MLILSAIVGWHFFIRQSEYVKNKRGVNCGLNFFIGLGPGADVINKFKGTIEQLYAYLNKELWLYIAVHM